MARTSATQWRHQVVPRAVHDAAAVAGGSVDAEATSRCVCSPQLSSLLSTRQLLGSGRVRRMHLSRAGAAVDEVVSDRVASLRRPLNPREPHRIPIHEQCDATQAWNDQWEIINFISAQSNRLDGH